MICMKKYLPLFAFFLALSLPAFADITECVNSSTASSCPSGVALRNVTFVTGFQGSTVLYCSADVDCVETGYFKCFNDVDGTSSSPYTGWCNSTAVTNCYVNGTAYNTSYYYCTTSAAYRQCSSGTWGSSTSCAANNTCTSGTAAPCATSSSASTTTTSSSSSNTTSTPTPASKSSLIITSAIKDFDLVQGDSASKPLTVKNDGNKTLTNIKLTIGGITAGIPVSYSVSPEKFVNLTVGSSSTFIVNFSAPENATVKSHSVTTEASSSETTASASFTLRVLPSNATVENTILPLFDSLKLLAIDLEKNITELESKGINTTALRRSLADIQDKLNQTDASIQKKDYFAAAQLLDSVKSLAAELQTSIAQAKAPGLDLVLIIIVIVIIAAVGIFAYLMWPSPEEGGFSLKKGWQKEKEEDSVITNLLQKIKKKKGGYVPR